MSDFMQKLQSFTKRSKKLTEKPFPVSFFTFFFISLYLFSFDLPGLGPLAIVGFAADLLERADAHLVLFLGL